MQIKKWSPIQLQYQCLFFEYCNKCKVSFHSAQTCQYLAQTHLQTHEAKQDGVIRPKPYDRILNIIRPNHKAEFHHMTKNQ